MCKISAESINSMVVEACQSFVKVGACQSLENSEAFIDLDYRFIDYRL